MTFSQRNWPLRHAMNKSLSPVIVSAAQNRSNPQTIQVATEIVRCAHNDMSDPFFLAWQAGPFMALARQGSADR